MVQSTKAKHHGHVVIRTRHHVHDLLSKTTHHRRNLINENCSLNFKLFLSGFNQLSNRFLKFLRKNQDFNYLP